MCGIIGIFSADGVSDRKILTRGNEALTHRGPDSSGEWWSPCGRLGFGHRRLSIIDLTTAGHQPMVSTAGDLVIIFNGEIYNHDELRETLIRLGSVFRSRSDTEVILEAYRNWGTDCVSRLNGMFALAIYDSRSRTVFLARDRAGEKPLFFYKSNGGFRFASELKAILTDAELPRSVNAQALDCYLTLGYVPGDRCMLEGFNKLPAAHAMLHDLDSDTIEVWRYWSLPVRDALETSEGQSLEDLESKLDCLLESAVRRQLQADVPIGVLLSGGVDSSLMVAMAARTESRVKTFNVAFPDHPSLNERQHARLIADHFGTEHIEIEARPSSVDVIPKLARQFDEPMADSSMIPTFILSEAVRQHCTVAVGGDGGDELFGGYRNYSRLLWMQQNLSWIPKSLRMSLSKLLAISMPVGKRGRVWGTLLGANLTEEYPIISPHFDASSRARLYQQSKPTDPLAEAIFKELVPENEANLLQRATRTDFRGFLAEDILVKVDRASMLSSLEVRAPFLDKDVIEFAFGEVPAKLKATPSNRKILLKHLVDKVLPASFDKTRKQGFSIPISAWLRQGEYRDFFCDTLLAVDSLANKAVVERLLKGQDKGHHNGERLLTLLMFELWRKDYGVSV